MQQCPMQQPRQAQQPRRLAVACASGGSGDRRPPSRQPDAAQLLKQFGPPALLGLLAGALMIRPLLVGLVFLERISVTLVGLAGVLACAVAAISLLWLAVPPLASIFGMSTVVTAGVGAGAPGLAAACVVGAACLAANGAPCRAAPSLAAVVLAAAAAGVFKVPALVPLLLLGGSLVALAFQAQSVFAVGGGSGSDSRDDGEAERLKGWQQEVSRCVGSRRRVPGARSKPPCRLLPALGAGCTGSPTHCQLCLNMHAPLHLRCCCRAGSSGSGRRSCAPSTRC